MQHVIKVRVCGTTTPTHKKKKKKKKKKRKKKKNKNKKSQGAQQFCILKFQVFSRCFPGHISIFQKNIRTTKWQNERENFFACSSRQKISRKKIDANYLDNIGSL